jgi:ketosteroid isomerase-like protein
MSIEENKAIVLRFFDKLAAKDIDAVLGLLSDSFTFWVAGKPESFALAGSTDKSQYAQMLRNFFPVFPKGFRLTPTGVTAEGDRVAVEAEWYGQTVTGKVYHNLYHLLFEVRDGKIQTGREYHDTLHAKETLMDP